jgi:hypothetical protein
MNSKVLILISLFCFSNGLLNAQHSGKDKQKHYLFGAPLHYSGFGGPVLAFSNLEGKFSVAPGATGGLIVNDKFFFSAFGQYVVTSHPRPDMITSGPVVYKEVKVNMWQYGAWFGYIHNPGEVIHWGISSMVARGQLFLMAKDPATLETREIYDDRVYFVTPKFFVEMNLAKWLKVNIGAGYRLTGKMNGEYSNQYDQRIPTFYISDYNHPEFSVSILVGGFPSSDSRSSY